MSIEKKISSFIESQFPAFYQEQGPNFIAFTKAYYEWAEQQNNFINLSRLIYDIKDIDVSPDMFLKYFKNKYISSFPESIISDKRLLVKHILDLYRAKGSERAYELLFRILFNEDINLFIPGEYIFKPSDATWYIPKYIEVSDHPNLKDLVGNKIYSRNNVSAIVENYYVKIVNQKTVNVLFISNEQGSFKFGEEIFCDAVPEIVAGAAPIIFGSLSSISITDGGANFNIGDKLNINGTGTGGIARVVSTKLGDGKVSFQLASGGYGYTLNAVVNITSGDGTGASFKVGDITNVQVYKINTDKIVTYYNTQMDLSTAGFSLGLSGSTGNFSIGEAITGTANTIQLDVVPQYLTVANGESLSNSSLGISGLVAYRAEGNLLTITGSDTNLLNANLVPGVVLVSNTQSALVQVNTIFPKIIVSANGTITGANSTVANVNFVTGYFVPGMLVTGNTTSHTATVVTDTRETDWGFAYPTSINLKSNLDTSIENLLQVLTLSAGTITRLDNINPGVGYSSAPTVEIIEPAIYDLRIPDGAGGYYGYDAIVNVKAGASKGIVTGVDIFDSGFGYTSYESLELSSNTNPTSVDGIAVVDLSGKGSGYWKDNKSFISDTMAIQDSYYYQDYSYEIAAPRVKESYEKLVRELVHPSGMALFGKFSIKTSNIDTTAEPVYFSVTTS